MPMRYESDSGDETSGRSPEARGAIACIRSGLPRRSTHNTGVESKTACRMDAHGMP
jgi:hypothetical protein